jgi:pteridine reductase
MFPDDMSAEEKEATREATLVKQADCPESMARAVQFLIENDFVTGVCLPVDGGRSIFAPTLARS